MERFRLTPPSPKSACALFEWALTSRAVARWVLPFNNNFYINKLLIHCSNLCQLRALNKSLFVTRENAISCSLCLESIVYILENKVKSSILSIARSKVKHIRIGTFHFYSLAALYTLNTIASLFKSF